MQRLFSRPIFGAFLVFLISFIVYLQTMAPAVPFIDGGELATVCATLGIAHPTGYPLFCMIGYLFANLPIASQVIMRVNIMSAFFVALGSGGMVFFISELYLYWFNKKRTRMKSQKGKKTPVAAAIALPEESISEEKKRESVAAGIFAGLMIAFSATWWETGLSVEVYPIHCFMVPIVLTFFFRMLRLGKEKFGKDSILFAFTLGLCFSNHLTSILLAPACIYMYFATFGFGKFSKRELLVLMVVLIIKDLVVTSGLVPDLGITTLVILLVFRSEMSVRLLKLAIPFSAGLLPYLYFPIRASQYPLMDWGHPVDLHSFLKHFTAGQYSVMMFTKEAPGKNWPYFWGKYPEEFTIVGAILVVCGLYALLNSSGRGKAHVLVFVILLFFGCLLWSMNYDIVDIDTYFLTAYLASTITATFGLIWLAKILKEKAKVDLAITVTVSGLLFGTGEVIAHYKEVDQSGNYFVENYTKNMLRNLPKNAIIFTSSWDFWASGAFYYQLVEKFRPDVFVVDVAMLRDRPWYFNHLKQRFPEVMRRTEPELSEFMTHLVRFDNGDPYDGQAIAQTYSAFTEALVSRNQDRPIFLSPEVVEQHDQLFAPGFKPYAAGLAYRFLPNDSSFDVPLPEIQWNDKNYRKRSYYTENSRWFQAMPLADRAQNLAQKGRLDEAKKFLDLALSFEPDMTVNLETLHGRDRDAAEHVSERFARIEEFRKSLGK